MQKVTKEFASNNISNALEMARNAPLAIENEGKAEFVIMSAAEYDRLTQVRKPRRAGYARRLFEGVDVDSLLAIPVPGLGAYIPE